MSFNVYAGERIHEINEADAGKFLFFFFQGLESRPFKFRSTEANLGEKNVISHPREHSLTVKDGGSVRLAVHLNFFCVPKIKSFAKIDIGAHTDVKVIQEIEFQIKKLHLTTRTKKDQDLISAGHAATQEMADRSPHRAKNAWGRPKNITNLAAHIAVSEGALVSALEDWGYADADFTGMFTMLETSLIDQCYAKFSNPGLKVTIDTDKSATFDD